MKVMDNLVDFLEEFDSSKRESMELFLKDKSGDDAALIVRTLVKSWRDAHKETYMRGVDGAPDWRQFEHEIWSLGDVLYKLIRKTKEWQNSITFLTTAANIAKNKDNGKGRQTFVLMLGEVIGAHQFSGLFAELLDDPEVCGHVVKALNKSKIAGHEKKVAQLLENSDGWIRKEAKKYLTDQGY